MKKFLLFTSIIFAVNTFSQTTLIPDANFEQKLIDLGYDTGVPDGSVPTSNVNLIFNLDISSSNINDLTGIQDFTYLADLNCYDNQLTSLDVSQNLILQILECSNNLLTSLDVSQNNALFILSCGNNLLTSLDVSQNPALQFLYCNDNQLTTLDVAQNTSLTILWSHNNQITSLDVTQNTALTNLYCHSNQLTSLDVSQNTSLTTLWSHNNQITSLDLSQNSNLNNLNCQNNLLTSLNLQNGNNNMLLLRTQFNPNLTCITVDNVLWSMSNWTVWDLEIDAQSSFSLDCSCMPTSSTLTETAIDSYNLNGTIYTQSGQFTQVIPNQAGCDSTITLNLSMNYTGINELNTTTTKKLSKIVDLTGREIQYQKNAMMIYVYEDGTSERVIEFE